MDFFTRASILSQVDGHIAKKRGSWESKRAVGKKIASGAEGKDIFSELVLLGIDSKLIGKLEEYFERFDFRFTPSVGNRVNWYGVLEENSYDLLRKIDLYDHTIRVANNALRDKKLEQSQRPLVALFALLHDIGKSEELCEYFGIKYGKGHERSSAEFIEIFLQGTAYEKLGKKFSDELLLMHKAKNEGEGFQELGFYGTALHEADSKARQEELRSLKGE